MTSPMVFQEAKTAGEGGFLKPIAIWSVVDKSQKTKKRTHENKHTKDITTNHPHLIATKSSQ